MKRDDLKIWFSCFVFALVIVASPVLAADNASQENNPWYWYNQAVDLANEGKFSEALIANEHALSLNESIPLAWANQAGILVQLHRYDEAVAAADRVLSVNSTDLPNTYAAAYYSKGDALRALGKTSEARDMYEKAYALDSTLVPPDLSKDTPAQASATGITHPSTTPPASVGAPAYPATTPRSPLSALTGIAALAGALLLLISSPKNRR